jgi:hypothetical protein
MPVPLGGDCPATRLAYREPALLAMTAYSDTLPSKTECLYAQHDFSCNQLKHE